MSYPTPATKTPPDENSVSWKFPFRKVISSAPSSEPLQQEASTFLLLDEPDSRQRGFLRRPSGHLPTKSDIDAYGQHEEEEQGSVRRMRPRQFNTNPQVARTICFILHIGLVVLHFILLGISIPHLEHRKVIPLGFQSTAWSTGLPALSQAFVTLYSAGMLVLTQQLSLRRNLLVRQTLTATHDKSSAWNGLGSALLGLWRQVSITASVWGVTCIMLYLAGISVLHISTPSLLTLETFNNTIQTTVKTTRGLPNQDVDTSDSATPVYDYFTQAAPILPLIGQYSQLLTIGLHGNTVYDVLSDNQGVGNVTVNSTTFEVSCDALPNPHLSGNGSMWNLTADPFVNKWNETVESDFRISEIAPNVVRMALSAPAGEPQYFFDGGNRALYYSSVNFTDSQGGQGSRVTLVSSPNPAIYSLQVMACRFTSRNETRLVDAQTKILIEPPPQKTSSTWGVPQLPTDFAANSTELSTIMDWENVLGEVSTLSSTTHAAECSGNCDTLTVLDQFLIQQLGIKPDLDPANDPQPRPQLELYQLENALANVTAALQWSTTQMNPKNTSGSLFYDMAFFGTATVAQPELASRLKLNIVPISAGLGTSVVLLVLAVMLVGNLEGNTQSLDSTGILQLMWLLRERPDLQRRISEVETPSPDDLRAAGMFLVRLAGESVSADHGKSYDPS